MLGRLFFLGFPLSYVSPNWYVIGDKEVLQSLTIDDYLVVLTCKHRYIYYRDFMSQTTQSTFKKHWIIVSYTTVISRCREFLKTSRACSAHFLIGSTFWAPRILASHSCQSDYRNNALKTMPISSSYRRPTPCSSVVVVSYPCKLLICPAESLVFCSLVARFVCLLLWLAMAKRKEVYCIPGDHIFFNISLVKRNAKRWEIP